MPLAFASYTLWKILIGVQEEGFSVAFEEPLVGDNI